MKWFIFHKRIITKTIATSLDTLQFAKKDDLANLKSDVVKLDIDKLKTVDFLLIK